MTPVALITGSSRGIGRGIALALADLHWSIVVNYTKNAEAAAEVAREIAKRGGKAAVVGADVADSGQRRRLVAESVREFGRIDLLVNNAGVTSEGRNDLLEAGEDGFDRVLAVNLKGPYFLTQLVAKQMIAQQKTPSTQRPAIVTVSSVSAYAASTNRGDYCIAKAGLGMLTKLFAARLAEFGINVYEIRPGIIATDMTGPVKAKYDALIASGLTPIKRWGQPDDVARAVVAIAQGLLPFSTGEVINVDGGFHLRTL